MGRRLPEMGGRQRRGMGGEGSGGERGDVERWGAAAGDGGRQQGGLGLLQRRFGRQGSGTGQLGAGTLAGVPGGRERDWCGD